MVLPATVPSGLWLSYILYFLLEVRPLAHWSTFRNMGGGGGSEHLLAAGYLGHRAVENQEWAGTREDYSSAHGVEVTCHDVGSANRRVSALLTKLD